MPNEFRCQWLVERIADKVAAVAQTYHLEVEESDERWVAKDRIGFGPESLLHFDIKGDRIFECQIDGDGPIITVVFSPRFDLALVARSAKKGRYVPAHAHDVACAILGLDEALNPLGET